MEEQTLTTPCTQLSHGRSLDRVSVIGRRGSSGKQCREAFSTSAAGLVAALATMSLPAIARAQVVSSIIPSFNVSASINNVGNGQYIENPTSPLMETYTNAGGTVVAIGNYGLLGASTNLTGGPDSDGPYEGNAYAGFDDAIPVHAAGPASELVPTNVSFSLFGGYTLSTDASMYDSTASVDVEIYAEWYNSSAQEVASGYYNYSQGEQDGVLYPGTTTGSLTFSASLQNDTTYYLDVAFQLGTDARDLGVVEANYPNTLLTNVSSTIAGTNYIGSQGTNYTTLTDPNNSATAPEPASIDLLLPLSAMPLLLRRRVASRR